MSGPYPILGMRRRERKNGAPYMVAVVGQDLIIPAGAEIHLRRLHDGRLSSPEFALQVVPPQVVPTKAQSAAAAGDRLDGSMLRVDARDHDEVMP